MCAPGALHGVRNRAMPFFTAHGVAWCQCLRRFSWLVLVILIGRNPSNEFLLCPNASRAELLRNIAPHQCVCVIYSTFCGRYCAEQRCPGERAAKRNAIQPRCERLRRPRRAYPNARGRVVPLTDARDSAPSGPVQLHAHGAGPDEHVEGRHLAAMLVRQELPHSHDLT